MSDIKYKKILKENFGSMKVLYVEDEEETKNLVNSVLKRYFTYVVDASNGEEAFEIYQKESFDIVISDISMPIMNGVTLALKIKELNPTQHIIILSAHNESDYLFNLINIGIDSFATKPIDMTLFLEILCNVCKTIFDERIALQRL